MSSKTKLPSTSHAANVAMTYEMRKQHHGKIIAALKSLGSGTYEELADFSGLESHAVGRRLSELEREQIVWKPGTQKKTKSNRSAYIYQLTGDSQPKTETAQKQVEKAMGEKGSLPEISRQIHKIAVAQSLFPEE